MSVDEIAALEAEHAEKPGLRAAQRRLAAEVMTIVHGADEAAAAELASGALFGRAELTDLPEATLTAALREAGAVELAAADSPTIVDAFVATGLADSKSAARRAVADGGAYVNNERVTDPELVLSSTHLLHGKWVVLRKGKRAISGVSVS